MNARIEMMEWPIVLQNDGGIRLAGQPDECFYCRRKVGEQHKWDCVTIVRRNLYSVLVDGVIVGIWETDDPFDWDKHQCEFHKNESTWCTGNAEDEIQWNDSLEAMAMKNRIELLEEDSCSCHLLEFRLVRTIDDKPRRSS